MGRVNGTIFAPPHNLPRASLDLLGSSLPTDIFGFLYHLAVSENYFLRRDISDQNSS